jgi:hypothetical protein
MYVTFQHNHDLYWGICGGGKVWHEIRYLVEAVGSTCSSFPVSGTAAWHKIFWEAQKNWKCEGARSGPCCNTCYQYCSNRSLVIWAVWCGTLLWRMVTPWSNHSGVFLWTASVGLCSSEQLWAPTVSPLVRKCISSTPLASHNTIAVIWHQSSVFWTCLLEGICVSMSWSPSLSPVWHDASRFPHCQWLFRPVVPHCLIHTGSDDVSINRNSFVCVVHSGASSWQMMSSIFNVLGFLCWHFIS